MATGAKLRGGVDVTTQQRPVLRAAGRRVGNAAGARAARAPDAAASARSGSGGTLLHQHVDVLPEVEVLVDDRPVDDRDDL